MKTDNNTFHVNLFYSYSHKDEKYRGNMETALSQLRRDKLLKEWSDHKILSGHKISEKIKVKMDEADIFVFLLSSDFIDSDACIEEWEYAKQLAEKGKSIFRIPIIVKDCSWIDFLGDDDVKALPDDGRPVTKFNPQNTAWKQVYIGIKEVINELRNTFIPKLEFIAEMEETGFVSLEHVKLQDIFVFPTLSYYPPQAQVGPLREITIDNQTELLTQKYALIHGQEMSGKTALGRSLFLSLVKESPTQVLHIDLAEIPKKHSRKIFEDAYYREFSGDYTIWEQQKGKILILDNLTRSPNSIDLIESAKDYFDKVFITLSSNVFYSYFRDESRLADFQEVKIKHLSHQQQEKLIRKRLILSDRSQPVTDGFVDQLENHVNSIITSQKIVPRYPFFVLSILQTNEGFMPDDLSITSYGHCYHALIVANLIKAGISAKDYITRDNKIDACFNFAEKLAFKIYQKTKLKTWDKSDFEEFLKEYNENYVVVLESILNRLIDRDYGIINNEGSFKTTYMYYFFLGRFLSKESAENRDIIEQMCEQSHVSSNYLTLLFIIHHTSNNQIIDDILLRTMCTLDDLKPASLNQDETDNFNKIVKALPKNVLSPRKSVEEKRKKERVMRDLNDDLVETEDVSKETIDENPVNDIYRILKNNEIMGQILRNKYGSLEKKKIGEIIETVGDSGLRLVKLLLFDEHWINAEANFLREKFSDHDIEEIKKFLQFFSFLWTIGNIGHIVSCINVPEIQDIVNQVVLQKSTPAYDLIGYFNHLDSVEELTDGVKQELGTLLKKHDEHFLQRVLSLETQHYMNTHRSKAQIEQSVCSLLNLNYTYRLPDNKT